MRIEQFTVGICSTNCYIAYNPDSKKGFIVDPGDEGPDLMSFIYDNGIDIEGILLTHGHFDHAGAAKYISNETKAPIIAYQGEEATLVDPELNLTGMFLGSPCIYSADRFLKDEEEIELAGFKIRCLFTPGHTPGGCCYYLPYEDLLFSGDTLFEGSVGRTDFPEGSMSNLVEGIRTKIMTLPGNTRVLSGHGSETTVEGERLYNPFL